MSRRSALVPQWQFSAALGAAVVLCGLFTVLLTSDLSRESRQTASAVGLLLGGCGIFFGGIRAMRRTTGRRRRAWLFIVSAAAVALAGNVWSAVLDVDPVNHPSLFAEGSLALALVLGALGLLGLGEALHRGAERLVLILDGIVMGCATLLITSVLVWNEVLDTEGANDVRRTLSILLPILDVALATLALFLIVRSLGNRTFWCFIGGGFILYAMSDMAFAVEAARGTFEFGTPLDLGWIIGYSMLSVATWHTDATRPRPRETPPGSFDVQGTVLVFGTLVAALAVQSTRSGEQVTPLQGALWVVLLLAAGFRQILLTADNAALRHGLEQRVDEQTADLRRMARETEVLLSSVGDGIYGVDLTGRVTFLNPSGAAALGQPPRALLGQVAHDRFHAPGEDGRPYDATGCYVTEAIRDGLVASGEEDVYVRADGTTFPVEITASPVRQGERVTGAVVVFRDVTQRREVDRMKNEFLSVVSHELRTPLTSIRGSLGLLAGGGLGQLSPQAARMISIAMDSSDRLTRLINDILDIERIQSGRLSMSLVPLQAAELLRVTASEMDGFARASDVRIEVAPSEGAVLADADRIVQTLTNLVGNAVKFSPPGALVRLEAVADETDVTFAVHDEGRGIPEDKLEAVFEPFEQVDSSDARQKGGTGLGLAISRGIVERHGGRIWAESVGGRGASVRFSLPRVAQVAGAQLPASSEGPSVIVQGDSPQTVVRLSSMLSGGGFQPVGVTDGEHAVDQLVLEVSTALRGRRREAVVLIVQPGDALVRSLRPRLEGQGLRVDHVRSGPEAARRVDELHPRVVLLDLGLAEPELMRKLRVEGLTVVLSTSKMSPEELEERMVLLRNTPTNRDGTP
ncbi:MAG TPA: ATP-binding protein [Marmoricola sp.]|nr:ATP-binding protein [Marmoricola sp.]